MIYDNLLNKNRYEQNLYLNIVNLKQVSNICVYFNRNIKIWVFHHTDVDGYCSGHIIERWTHYNELKERNNEVILTASDYSTDFSKFDIQKNDIVVFVDLSFTANTVHHLKNINNITKNIIWIDHHASNISLVEKDPDLKYMIRDWMICVLGNKENKYSAAMLTFCTLFDSIPDNAPYYIKLTSDWDTWTHEMEESIYFNEAMNGDPDFRLIKEDGSINENSTYIKLWKEDCPLNYYEDKLEIKNRPKLRSLIDIGKPVVEDRRNKDARYLHSNGFEFNLLGYSVLACNKRSNSLLFGDRINDYDLVCPFVLQQRNGKLIYTYSLFTAKDDIDCKEIAEMFGGGGHQAAAGFSLKQNIFTIKSWRLKLLLFMKKIKLLKK